MNQNWMATIMTMPRQVDRRKCSNFILHISYCTVCSMKFEHPPVQYEIWTPSFCAVWNLNTLLCSMKFEHPPSVQYEIWTPVNLAWHDPKLQHGSSDIVRIEEPFRLNVVCPLRIPPSSFVLIQHLIQRSIMEPENFLPVEPELSQPISA